MPRPRIATAVLEAKGAFVHDPQRKASRASEPKPDPCFGNAPRYLTKPQKAIWRELVGQIAPSVATKADRVVVEVTVRMIDRMRNHTEAMRASDYATLNRCLSQLGMTPADRSKIHVAEAPKQEEWEKDFGKAN